MSPDIAMLEEMSQKSASRRAFLTKGAVGAAGAVAAASAFTALSATPAGAVPTQGDVSGNGSLALLNGPVRIYDSRGANPSALTFGTGASGIFTKGDAGRQILIGHNDFNGDGGTDVIPEHADGVFINITVTNTVAFGALGVAPASASSTGISIVNWSSSGQSIANSTFVPTSFVDTDPTPADSEASASKAFDEAGIMVFFVGGTNGVSQCHFIIDCLGFVVGT